MIPVEVKLWGTTIGALSQEDGDDFGAAAVYPSITLLPKSDGL